MTAVLLVAGVLAPATGASGEPTTTTTTAPTSTTTTTTAAPTTTTTAAPTTTTTTAGERLLGGGGVEGLSSGSLAVTVPDAAQLPAAPATATTLSAALGTVTVTDARGDLVASWTATVSASDFTTGAGTSAETIPRGNISYWSGPASAVSGVATFVPSQLTEALAQRLDAARTAFSAAAGAGATSASWQPTIAVHIPAGAVAGIYTGTITHSVA